MRDNIIATHYSTCGNHRFEVIHRKNNLFQVWAQSKIYDDYMGDDWFDWADISDSVHITDTIERAVEIGKEALANLC